MSEALIGLAMFILGLKLGRAWKRWEIVNGLDAAINAGDVIAYTRKSR